VKVSELSALLHRSESETLDYKSKQYLLAGASDEQKSELIKDIVSIANAFKESAGYIVIGVEEEHGRAKRVCGADATLGDSDVQQLVNSKTNRSVLFLVEVVSYKGVKVTVIKIDGAQSRPIFLSKNFGKLKSNVVYIRRGSSTAEATPDEIADMGRDESIASKEADKQLAKKEKEDRFWRDFREDLRRFAATAFHFRNVTNCRQFDALVECALPAEEISAYFRQARELDMQKQFVDELSQLAAKLKKLEECRKQGAVVFEDRFPNLRSDIQDVDNLLREMKQKYSAS
jgi:hypothetical protein